MFSFVNIQGLCPQTKPSSVPYLKDLTNCSKQLFLALTETWLTDNHKKGELEIENYKFFKKNRDRVKSKYGRASGGVAFYVRNDIAPFFEPIFEFSNGVNEALMLLSKILTGTLIGCKNLTQIYMTQIFTPTSSKNAF